MANSRGLNNVNIYISNENGENPRAIEGVQHFDVRLERPSMYEEDNINMLIAQAARELGAEGERRMRVRMSDEMADHIRREDGIRQMQRMVERQIELLNTRVMAGEYAHPFQTQQGRQIYKAWNSAETESLLKSAKAKLPPTNNREAVKLLETMN